MIFYGQEKTTLRTVANGILLSLLLIQVLLLSNQVMAGMFGFLKKQDVHLSPEVHGQVEHNGKPVPDLLIIRTLTYGKEYRDTTFTDDDGRFFFQKKTIKSRRPGILLDETRLRQIISADDKGEKYLLWYAVTDSTEPEKTVTEKMGRMHCDLTSKKELQHFVVYENPSFTHDVFSICRWED